MALLVLLDSERSCVHKSETTLPLSHNDRSFVSKTKLEPGHSVDR